MVCFGLTAYEQNTSFEKTVIGSSLENCGTDFLSQSWGMNYFYYKIGKAPFEVDKTFLDKAASSFKILSIQYPYFVSQKESSKATVIKAQDSINRYSIVIKNKNGRCSPRHNPSKSLR